MSSKYLAALNFAGMIFCGLAALKTSGNAWLLMALVGISAMNAFMFIINLCNFVEALSGRENVEGNPSSAVSA